MKFVNFNLVEGDGKTSEIPINPYAVLTVLPITIQGKLSGPDGQPVGRPAAGLCAGMKIIPVNCTVADAIDKIETAINDGWRKDEDEEEEEPESNIIS